LDPFRDNDSQIIPNINKAITKDPYWTARDLKFEYKQSVLNPHDFMHRQDVCTLTVLINNLVVATYSSHSQRIIMDVLKEVFIQYRIDLDLINLHKRKVHMTLPATFFCATPTCGGNHTDVKSGPCAPPAEKQNQNTV
jgi:hypothetical protein